MQLLEDIVTYQEDFKQKIDEEKKAASRKALKEKMTGERMRNAAMERMSSMCNSHS